MSASRDTRQLRNPSPCAKRLWQLLFRKVSECSQKSASRWADLYIHFVFPKRSPMLPPIFNLAIMRLAIIALLITVVANEATAQDQSTPIAIGQSVERTLLSGEHHI